MKIGKYRFQLKDLKLFEFKGFNYFVGTYRIFGLESAITQLSPLLNLVIHRKYFT